MQQARDGGRRGGSEREARATTRAAADVEVGREEESTRVSNATREGVEMARSVEAREGWCTTLSKQVKKGAKLLGLGQ